MFVLFVSAYCTDCGTRHIKLAKLSFKLLFMLFLLVSDFFFIYFYSVCLLLFYQEPKLKNSSNANVIVGFGQNWKAADINQSKGRRKEALYF